MVLDENGDRDPDYWITDMAPNGTFIKIAEILNGDGATKVSMMDVMEILSIIGIYIK